MDTKDRVNWAFRKLRQAGYFAKQNFWCCQSCGWAAVPDEKADRVVFYHHQDNASWGGGRELVSALYLAWSGDGEEIVLILESCGLTVEWSGSENSRIVIVPEKVGG